MVLQCECGRTCTKQPSTYFAKPVKCKCIGTHRTHQATIGRSATPEYMTWSNMIRRCYASHGKDFQNYGGRGITVCDRWRHSFQMFFRDMGERPSKSHTIERINNDLGYSPDNCTWATRKRQNNNKRSNFVVTVRGTTRTLMEWSELTGISYHSLKARLYKGWSFEEALEMIPRIRQSSGCKPKILSSISIFIAVVMVACCSMNASAQSPKAVITGPKESREGDLVILDASQSQGQKYIWQMAETDKSFAQVENNTKVFFSAGLDPDTDGTVKPRDFHFFLCVGGSNPNGNPEISLAQHVVTIKPRYAPPKPPEPTPNPTPPVPTPGKASAALLLYESSESTQDLTKLILQLRTEGIKNLKLLDKDAKQSDSDEPVKQAADLVKVVGSKPLPRVVCVDSSGSVVADADVKTFDDVVRLLASWGLK